MAYAALVSLAQTLDQISNPDHYSISLRKRETIEYFTSVQNYVNLLLEFLEDFPEQAHGLEGRIRNLANEAEDTMDFHLWQRFRIHRDRDRSHPCEEFHIHGCHFPELDKVAKKFQSIAEEVMKIRNSLAEQQRGDSPASTSSSAMDSLSQLKNRMLSTRFRTAGDNIHAYRSMSDRCGTLVAQVNQQTRIGPTYKDAMIGFHNDLIAIKARLCGESTRLQVIPIVGMGGIGKTTLARHAFDDPLVLQYFHIRAWVTVSQTYCAEEILSGLLVSIEEFNTKKHGRENDSVEDKVHKSLRGNKYLIVMDDMWSTKAWDDLNMVLPDDNNGSRIMLTSRLVDVAAHPDPCSPLYEMGLMDGDQSWDLLRNKVFDHEDCPPELQDIGKEIARSCRGLPLAVVVVAGLLSMVSKTRSTWRNIAKNVNSTIAAKDGQLGKILSLSYTRLPHHLRPCFLYMGGFPEDYKIRVSELVKLWVAEGFLKCKDGSKSPEEVAEEYVEDLAKRSLVFVWERKSNGKIKSCNVHDLVRDLCIRKAQEEKFFLHAEKSLPDMMENQRHLSVAHLAKDFLAGNNDSAIRTIKCFGCANIATSSLGDLKLLRVLVVVNTFFKVLDHEPIPLFDQFSEMLHLRYLDLHSFNFVSKAISNFRNLQTIIIRVERTSRDYPMGKVHLPRGIWRMPQLRHLISYFFGDIPTPYEESFALENLQTLTLATNLKYTKLFVQKVPNLEKLGIFYHGRDLAEDYYHLENLVHLHHLEVLKIQIYADCSFRRKINCVFPTKLKKLTLSGRQLPWEEIRVVASLPHLEVLKLREFAFKGSTWETNDGEFPELKFLLIDKSDLQHWITESSHFPRLKSLLLHRCWCLKSIPDGIGEIPTLELIEVDNGNNSLVESAKGIQEEQQSWGNEVLQVRLVRR